MSYPYFYVTMSFMRHKVDKVILAYDIGRTKVAVGVVSNQGRVLEEIRVPILIQKGKKAVFNPEYPRKPFYFRFF